MLKSVLCGGMVLALAASPLIEGAAAARAPKVKYAKSEVDKAVGKCVGTVLGGAFLGALIAGKKDRATGALAGAAVGGGICALIVDDAKKKDRVFEAQLRAASAQNGQHTSTFTDDAGVKTTVVASAGEAQMMPASLLVPVKYTFADSTTSLSPAIAEPEALCRMSAASIQAASQEMTKAPDQLVCRTEAGDWAPYSLMKSRIRA